MTKDPFFSLPADSEWNACIGRQGDEENYIDGYIEAAAELAGAVIDKKMYEKRDTLVLPILYNARHAVELALKFTTNRLAADGLISAAGPPNHDIKAYWERLNAASLGDEKLSQTLLRLKPFVDSLARIDIDGQELRYHVNRTNDTSLSNYSLANLEVIRANLTELAEIISVLKYRTASFLDERRTDAYTERCSRRDLFTIAQLIPRRDTWRDPIFDEQKEIVKSRFNLSNKQFSAALNTIENNREMKAILGVETDLMYLADDEIIWIVEQWRRIHPRRSIGESNIVTIRFDSRMFEEMKERFSTENTVISEIDERINAEKLAEIETIFYLSRDRWMSEYYERRIEEKKKEHAVATNSKAVIRHLMCKTNFLDCVQQSAIKLGRLSLSTKLENL